MSRKRRFPLLDDVEWLRRKYECENATAEEIAADVGCSGGLVSVVLRSHGIQTRTPAQQSAIRGTVKQSSFPELRDAEWLREKYIEERLSTAAIAALVGCCRVLVSRALNKYGIPIRKAGGETGQYYRNDPPKAEGSRSRPTIYLGPNRKIDGRGNVVVFVKTSNRGSWVQEHRLIAERELGRRLVGEETVHHINCNHIDNRPENLIVLPDNIAHRAFHSNPPAWVPRCECCGKPNPEILTGRPAGVPILYEP